MKKLLALSLALIFVLAIAAPAPSAIQARQDTLKIGILTDQSSALQAYGFEQVQGFELGLDYATGGTMEVAGRPIELVVRDNANDAATAVEDARILIEEDGVEILQGTVSSTVTLNVMATAEENEMVLMAGPAATPSITGADFNEYTFRVCRNTFQDAFAVASYAVDVFGPNYIILAADAAFGIGTAAAFDYALSEVGATPVQDTLLVAYDTTDFTPALTEVLESGADFTIIVWAGAGGVTLINQANDLGVFDQMGLIQGTDTNYHVALGNLAIQDTVAYIVYHYTLPENEINDWMVEQHVARYSPPEAYVPFYPEGFEGEVPGLFTECGFASAQALVYALEETGGDTDPAVLIPALEGLRFDGPKGEYYIRPEDHQALQPMYIIEVATETPEEPFAWFNLVSEVSGEDAAPPCLAPGRSSDNLTCPDAE